jgi:hypothetical protein
MDVAQAELERIAAPKQANSDAAALAGYFAALGLNVQTDAINRLLVLLGVLVIECGGGLALGPRTRSERSPNAMVFAPVRRCSRSRKAVGERLCRRSSRTGQSVTDQHS